MVVNIPVSIRRMCEADLGQAAEIHGESFARQRHSREWLRCNLNAWPRVLSYVASNGERCLGYIFWTQKSGFRPEVVLELEQVAVTECFRGKGVGRRLIEESLNDVRAQLGLLGASLKHIMITTRADNHAQRLYRAVLGAEVEAVLRDLYSADEVIMIARQIRKHNY